MKALFLLSLLAVGAAAVAGSEAPTSETAAARVETEAPLSDTETLRQSLGAMNELVEVFNADSFFLNKIIGIGGAIIKGISWVRSILNRPGRPGPSCPHCPDYSEEFRQLGKQIAQVQAKLDGISLQLDQVLQLIEWQTTRQIYAQYEIFLHATSSYFDAYIASSDEVESEVLKDKFMTAWQRNDPMATLKLYQAVVTEDFMVSKNLAAAVKHFTHSHRRQVMNFLLAMLRLVMRGAQMEIAYDKLAKGDGHALWTQRHWDHRLQRMVQRIQQLDAQIRNGYHQQMLLDVERETRDKQGLSNRGLSEHLHRYLTEKFHWRTWFTLAYSVVADEHQNSHPCHGVLRLRTHGNRNIVVASSDPQTSRFTHAKGVAALEAAQAEGTTTINTAGGWTGRVRAKVGSCEDAAFVGSILSGTDFWAVAPEGRSVHKKMTYSYRVFVRKTIYLRPVWETRFIYFDSIVFG